MNLVTVIWPLQISFSLTIVKFITTFGGRGAKGIQGQFQMSKGLYSFLIQCKMISAIRWSAISSFCRSRQALPYKGLQGFSLNLESSSLIASWELDGEILLIGEQNKRNGLSFYKPVAEQLLHFTQQPQSNLKVISVSVTYYLFTIV